MPIIKIIGTQNLLMISFRALEEIAKKTDNNIDNEVVESVKFILLKNFK